VTRAKLIYNKLRDRHGFGLREILPGWQDIIYSESEGWLVPWEKALLKGEPVNSVVAKLNRRKGQLQRTTVLNGAEKVASEQETFDFICLLIRCDTQLKHILQ
jgi:predicted Ser/Thr protein kinase